MCCISQLMSLISTYFYLLPIVIPIFAFYKLWVNVLGPWFFAPAPEEGDEKNLNTQKKREKFVKIRR
jgi:hypothetical protein